MCESLFSVVLFPSSFMNTKQIDEDFEQEYEAVLDNGQLHPILFG